MPLDGAPISLPPLPEGWSLSERVDDVVHAEGLAIRRVGLCATTASGQAVGSAAELAVDPGPRAALELLERIAVTEASRASDRSFRVRSASGELLETACAEEVFPQSDAPDRWAFARSNGVSLHTDWAMACDAAAAELIERDRVLRAWMGETVPVRLGCEPASWPASSTPSYDWRAYLFPEPDPHAVGAEFQVVGVFAFPKSSAVPLAFGFAARRDSDEAIRCAGREALQLLAFLWGEPIPERAPNPVPTPMTHLETYQVRDRQPILLRWLEEGHATHFRPRSRSAIDASLRFADLTPSWLEGRFHVVRALCPTVVPLVLGHAPVLAHLPSELRIHPIP